MLTKCLLSALMGCVAFAAAAETAYVTDSLRLGLHRAADTSDSPIVNLVSGTELDVLERNRNFARVRTADGREGWVKAAFLVAAKPGYLRAAELESEIETMRAQLDAADAARRRAEEQLASTGAAAAANAAAHETIARLQSENAAYEQRFESYRRSLPLPWVATALLVAAAAGFLGGLWWLDALIRRRHGGFRVY